MFMSREERDAAYFEIYQDFQRLIVESKKLLSTSKELDASDKKQLLHYVIDINEDILEMMPILDMIKDRYNLNVDEISRESSDEIKKVRAIISRRSRR
jgi:hypothetical protein